MSDVCKLNEELELEDFATVRNAVMILIKQGTAFNAWIDFIFGLSFK